MAELDEMRQQLDLLSDEELSTILQEHDQEQWRPEAFDIVRSILQGRGVSPEGESAERDSVRKDDILLAAEALDLVTVAAYPDYLDAEADRDALEAKGLRGWVFSSLADGLGGAELKVRKGDWRAAMDLLELTLEESVPSSDLPEDIAEPPCPRCGSRNVTEHAELVDNPDGSSLSRQAWLYHCASCGHKWDAES